MKKFSLSFLVLMMVIFLAACGSASNTAQEKTETKTNENTNQQEKPAQETAKNDGFPEKPVRLIVQYPAGGGVDVTARLFAKHAEKYLGQKIIVENKTGGSGAIGVTSVATSKPDGYTLGVVIPNTITDELLLNDIKYNADSFAPIVQINADPSILAVKGDSPIKSLEDFVNKAKSGKTTIGIGAVWTTNDFVKLQLEKEAGIELTRIPYQGGAPVTQSLLAGDIDSGTQYPGEIIDYYKSGELRGLAISTPEKVDTFSEIPTFKEQGYDIEFNIWRMIAAPAGTPQEHIDVLEEAFMKALEDPETAKDFNNAGLEISALNSAQSQEKLKSEAEKYKAIISDLGLEPGANP